MVKPEDFRDRSDVLASHQQLWLIGVVRRHPGGELASVLNVEQHSRQQPRDLARPLLGANGTATAAGQMVNRRDAALVIDLTH